MVMGVTGCGKSTLGRELARRMGAAYVEGDELHPTHNVRAMSEGRALTDEMRAPWLRAVAEATEAARRGGDVVTACSALRKPYRDLLRKHVRNLGFVFLNPLREVLEARLAAREGHFMRASMLQGQIDTLEPPGPPERVIHVPESGHSEHVARLVLGRIRAMRG